MFATLKRFRRREAVAPVATPASNLAHELIAGGIFSPDFYLQLNPDVAAAGAEPARHYAEHGHREGRQPHPLMDIGWYADQLSPDERSANPLLHYAEKGAALGLSPNVFFDTRWYQEMYAPAGNPLAHFSEHGGHLTNPSHIFDAVRYYRDNPDVAATGINPLVHFMIYGMDEGRAAHTVPCAETAALACGNAKLVRRKHVARRYGRTALLITHAPKESIKPHVEHYARAFAANGVDVCLIVAADSETVVVPPALTDICSSIYVRENVGFDFAAWAHVLADDQTLRDSETLYLTNDSIIGPLDNDEFATMLADIEGYSESLIGLTDNRFYAWHLQSYFLAVKQPCLSSEAFGEYFKEILNLKTKTAVIRNYEITFTRRMERAGFAAAALFPMSGAPMFAGNRAVLDWRGLADCGMPFLKASLIFGEQKLTEGPEARFYLSKRGFDPSLLPL